MRRFDFVALGEPMVEFNQTRPGHSEYLQGFGGDTSNATLAAARAGARTAYLTRLGNDPWGRALLDLWAREGVNTEGVDLDPLAPTGVYFVTHGQQGHAFSYLRTGSAASLMSPDNLSATARLAIQQAHWLHVSGISLAISTSACDTVLAAMAWARECQTQVSLDANLRLKLWPLARAQACLKQALSLCDLFLPSEDEVKLLMGADDPLAVLDWAQQAGAQHVVLKRGPQGAVVRTGSTQFAVPGHAVQRMDATGAGDCFAGNLITRLAKGDDWPRAVRYANAAAALSVQGYGAVAPLPRPNEVQSLLQRDLP